MLFPALFPCPREYSANPRIRHHTDVSHTGARDHHTCNNLTHQYAFSTNKEDKNIAVAMKNIQVNARLEFSLMLTYTIAGQLLIKGSILAIHNILNLVVHVRT